MSHLAAARDSARRQSDFYRALAHQPQHRKESGASFLGGLGGQSLNSILSGQQQQSEAEQQYERFRGWQFCAIRAIATRAASQPVAMGRLRRASQMPKRRSDGLSFYKAWERARLPLGLKAVSDPIEKIPEHALLTALNHPNPLMVRWSLLYVTIASLELTGVAYWWFTEDRDRETGEVRLQVWPMPSHWVKPVHEDGKFFSRYLVTPHGSVANRKYVSGEQVARFALPNPSDPLGFISPLQTQAKAVAADEMILDSQYHSFRNGMKPGVILTAGRLPDDPVTGQPGQRPVLESWQRRELIEAIRGAYQGVQKADEPFIIDGLIEDVKKFTLTPVEMDYTASGGITKSRILQSYGVNPLVLGEIQAGNRAQAAVAEDNFNDNVVNPLLEYSSQVITEWMPRAAKSFEAIPDEDAAGDYVFWFQPARARDADLTLAEYAGEPGPCVTINEYRQDILGKEPMKGGDVTVDEYRAAHSTPAPPAVSVAGQELPESPESEDDEVGEDFRKPTKPPKKIPGKRKDFLLKGQSADDASDAAWAKQHAAVEADLTAVVLGFFRSQAPQVTRLLATSLATNRPDETKEISDSEALRLGLKIANEIYDQPKYAKMLVSRLRGPLRRAGLTGAAGQILTLAMQYRQATDGQKAAKKKKKKPPAPKIADPVLDRVMDEVETSLRQPWWRKTAKTTRDDLAIQIKRGLLEGDSGDKLAKRVLSVFRGTIAKSRAQNIARTEATSALMAGNRSVIDELRSRGVAMVTRWNSTLDGFARPAHAEAHRQAADKSGNFTVGGEVTPHPGHYSMSAANRCQCRCNLTTDNPFGDPANAELMSDEKFDTIMQELGIA